jgi:cytoplasmic iron level regulating protein YaaA (DUF328/UPF0246 family)
LHAFALNGYAYSAELSDGDNLVFTRG